MPINVIHLCSRSLIFTDPLHHLLPNVGAQAWARGHLPFWKTEQQLYYQKTANISYNQASKKRVLTTLENMVISGNLLILENSGNTRNLKFTQGIYKVVCLGHRIVCIIVNNSSINWLGDTVTGLDRASHHAPSIKFYVILQESCRTDYGDLLHRVITL